MLVLVIGHFRVQVQQPLTQPDVACEEGRRPGEEIQQHRPGYMAAEEQKTGGVHQIGHAVRAEEAAEEVEGMAQQQRHKSRALPGEHDGDAEVKHQPHPAQPQRDHVLEAWMHVVLDQGPYRVPLCPVGVELRDAPPEVHAAEQHLEEDDVPVRDGPHGGRLRAEPGPQQPHADAPEGVGVRHRQAEGEHRDQVLGVAVGAAVQQPLPRVQQQERHAAHAVPDASADAEGGREQDQGVEPGRAPRGPLRVVIGGLPREARRQHGHEQHRAEDHAEQPQGAGVRLAEERVDSHRAAHGGGELRGQRPHVLHRGVEPVAVRVDAVVLGVDAAHHHGPRGGRSHDHEAVEVRGLGPREVFEDGPGRARPREAVLQRSAQADLRALQAPVQVHRQPNPTGQYTAAVLLLEAGHQPAVRGLAVDDDVQEQRLGHALGGPLEVRLQDGQQRGQRVRPVANL